MGVKCNECGSTDTKTWREPPGPHDGFECRGCGVKLSGGRRVDENQPKRKGFILMQSVWLRRVGDRVQVLVEVDDQYSIAIDEDIDAQFSHCAHAVGFKDWKVDDA